MGIIDEFMTYIARCADCGGVFMMCVDTPGRAAPVADQVAEAIRDGGRVERVTLEQARAEGLSCKCPPGASAEVPGPHVPTDAQRLAAWNAGAPRRWPSQVTS